MSDSLCLCECPRALARVNERARERASERVSERCVRTSARARACVCMRARVCVCVFLCGVRAIRLWKERGADRRRGGESAVSGETAAEQTKRCRGATCRADSVFGRPKPPTGNARQRRCARCNRHPRPRSSRPAQSAIGKRRTRYFLIGQGAGSVPAAARGRPCAAMVGPAPRPCRRRAGARGASCGDGAAPS